MDYVIAIPSYKRHDTLKKKTLVVLKDYKIPKEKILIFVANKSEYDVYNETLDPKTYGKLVIGKPGIKQIRNFMANYFSEGQKIVYMDDDIGKIWECVNTVKPYDKSNNKTIKLLKASGNNLKNINLNVPLGKFICVTGVSGSGKSTLINGTLYPILSKEYHSKNIKPLPYSEIDGILYLDKIIEINQSPIGRTPRSNPATYTGLFTLIRDLYSSLPESNVRGYLPGRFSFNVKGGRCEICQGVGLIKIEMHFLADMYIKCDECNGKRFNRETLEILYKGKNISDILNMSIQDAMKFFNNHNLIMRKLDTLNNVGLGYIRLGQQATTLSGGESQRVKLASELSKVNTGRTMYILDEPTTGLHFEDINMLLNVLHGLVDKGNTVIVIEHNLDVIKSADWIVDLGPEGGNNGGEIIGAGTPESLINNKKSYTGKFLKKILKNEK